MNPTTSTFTPVAIDMDKPRDWASDIGMLDWDKSAICFSKRNLLEFLKSIGVTVGSNLTELNRLPHYATLGKMTANTNESVAAVASTSASVPKVSNDILGDGASAPAPSSVAPDVAMADSPPPTPHAEKYSSLPVTTEPSTPTPSASLDTFASQQQYQPAEEPKPAAWKPTRRVTQAPGGASSMASMFGGDDDGEDQFAASNARRGRI